MENLDLKKIWNDQNYGEKGKIWGNTPSKASMILLDILKEHNMPHQKKIKVLDAGCGYGRDTVSFYKFGLKVYGLDFSKNAIDIARAQDNNIDYRVGDVKHLPYNDNHFDVVYSNYVFHWFNDTDRRIAILETFRVLKKSGLFFCCIPCFNEMNASNCIFSYNGTIYDIDALRIDFKDFNILKTNYSEEVHTHGGLHVHEIFWILASKR